MTAAPLAHPDRTIVVIGGGWWGHLHATRLLTARERGKSAFRRLLVVDRLVDHAVKRALGGHPDVTLAVGDWDAFLAGWIGRASAPGDLIVPAPIAPHLFFNWLVGRLRSDAPCDVAVEPVSDALGTPFDLAGDQGERFGSFAEWRCPVSCLEPAVCPAIRRPRTWEMAEHLTGRWPASDVLEVFVARHHAWGIATVPVESLWEASGRLKGHVEARAAFTLRVATVSACHGVVGQARVWRRSPAQGEGVADVYPERSD